MKIRFIAFLVLCIACLGFIHRTSAQDAQLVSVCDLSQPASITGSGASQAPIISPNGGMIAFASTANNLALSANGTPFPLRYPPPLNVYLRNRSMGTTYLVSVNQSGTGGGNGNSMPTGISANGRYVLFESSASDLVEGDTNNATDVFVYDSILRTTTLVSANTNGIPGNQASGNASITYDGRFVTFVSSATDLTADPTNGIPNIYVRDLESATTTLATPGAGASPYSSRLIGSDAPDITIDGRHLLFFSTAYNLAPGSIAGNGDIYVRNLQLGMTDWISAEGHSLAEAAGFTNVACHSHVISSNGVFVAYQAARFVLRYKLSTGETDVVSTNASTTMLRADFTHNLDISPDGNRIAFVAADTTIPGATTIQVWNASTGLATSASDGISGVSQCANPTFSQWGNALAFLAGDTDACNLYLQNSQQKPTLVNTRFDGSPAPLNWYATFGLSADGRYIAFDCSDDSIVQNDRNRSSDVFLKDLSTGSVEVISAHHPALASISPNGLSSVLPNSTSKDGHRIAFMSTGNDLVPNDLNECRDVFVRDLNGNTNILVSVATNGLSGNGPSFDPVMSGNGRYVAFASKADNLIPGDTNARSDVFVRDLDMGTTILVSINSDGLTPGSADSDSPQISDNGQFVLFRNNSMSVFFRDIRNAKTYALTTDSSDAQMTSDGRYVAIVQYTHWLMTLWDSAAGQMIYTNHLTAPLGTLSSWGLATTPDGKWLITDQITNLVVLNLADKTARVVPRAASPGPQVRPNFSASADGRLLTYLTRTKAASTDLSVQLCDLQSGAITLVSHQAGSTNPASGRSDSPQFSADGRFIAYRSSATNLVAGHTNGLPVVVLYDTVTASNALLSASSLANVNDRASIPVFSGDGHSLFFQSWNYGLCTNNYHYASDVYTAPLFYVAASTTVEPDGILISWPETSGKSYRVEYTENLAGGPWQTLQGDLVHRNHKVSIVDTATAGSPRFYRVAQW